MNNVLNKNAIMQNVRRWSRVLHRDLSFLFSGMLLIYAISGIVMNHRNSINPHYTVDRQEFALEHDIDAAPSKDALTPLLSELSEANNYTKHYSPKQGTIKIFLKGGSNIFIDINAKEVVYEKLSRRTIISPMVKLHYNPGQWWTLFADIFAVGIIIVVVSGLVMLKGRKGLWGRGGIELLIGILIPLAFLFL